MSCFGCVCKCIMYGGYMIILAIYHRWQWDGFIRDIGVVIANKLFSKATTIGRHLLIAALSMAYQ